MPLFHMHIDATVIGLSLADVCRKNFGFSDTNFAHIESPWEHFEPRIHQTFKTRESRVLKTTFREVKELLSGAKDFSGYLESECVVIDADVSTAGLASTRPLPFKVTNRKLIPQEFRSSELHITLVADAIDAPVCSALRAMGFFTAFMDKPYGLASIFTIQGTLQQIEQIRQPTMEFLKTHGGFRRCSVMEERVVDWWISDSSVQLPPVIDHITFS